MNKMLIAAVLLVSMVSGAFAYQMFTTPDGAFTGALLDGQITTVDVNAEAHITGPSQTYRWQTFDGNGFSVAMLETRDTTVTAPSGNQAEGAVNACRNTPNCTVLTDEAGVYNGFEGRQYSFTIPNNAGNLVQATCRVWESKTGQTIYGMCAYEAANNPNPSRVASYLNSAILH